MQREILYVGKSVVKNLQLKSQIMHLYISHNALIYYIQNYIILRDKIKITNVIFNLVKKKRRGRKKKREKAQINENGLSTPTTHTLRDQILNCNITKDSRHRERQCAPKLTSIRITTKEESQVGSLALLLLFDFYNDRTTWLFFFFNMGTTWLN